MSRRTAAAVAAGAVLALTASTALAVARVPFFHGWYYQLAWYPTLLALDAAHALRYGEAPLLGRPRLALSLWSWSIPAWLLFEAVNFRIANWYYVLASPDPLVRRVSAALAFATVLPAIHLAHRWMESLGLARGWRGPAFTVGRGLRAVLVVAGVAFAALALWRPRLFFPLVWGSVTLIVEPWNHRRDPAASLLGDLAAGRWGRPVRLLAAGAVVGLLWESFNALAATRWIYTVPGLEGFKLFEMPLPGYLGFPVFALDCFVIYRALVNLGVAVPGWHRAEVGPDRPPSGAPARAEAADRPPGPRAPVVPLRTAAAALAAAAFSLAVLSGIDRWTVDSFDRGLEGLPGAVPEIVEALRRAGYGSVDAVAAADPAELARRAALAPESARTLRDGARLATLRGLGTANAAALLEAGIRSPCGLAGADPGAVAAAVRARRTAPRAAKAARVRVWIRAAREACRGEARAGGRRRDGEARPEGKAAGAAAERGARSGMETEALERSVAWAEGLFAPQTPTHAWIVAEEEARELPRIEVSALEGRLLAILATLARPGGARRVLEIGTLGGYSGLWLLSAVPHARLVTVERDGAHARLAREAFGRAGVEDRVTILEGDAREVVPGLVGSERFDLVFIDADKRSYPDYLAWSADLLEPGGLLLADNAFLSGRVVDPEPEDEDAAAMAEFARRLAEDPRFEATVVPIRDGLAVARFGGPAGEERG